MGINGDLPSGELSHSNGKIHHAINGKIHYFDWAIFNCHVSSPEGRLGYTSSPVS